VPYPRLRFSDEPIYDRPTPAITVLADALNISEKDALTALTALVRAGYVIAPRLPTNAMLSAYLRAYGTPATTIRSCIIGIGKARKRWAAMAAKGTQMALSRRRVTQKPVTSFPPCDENGGTVVSISRSNGGHARAASLSPERRQEIARRAANARWAACDSDGTATAAANGDLPVP
jgi:hypothetical protein